MFSMDDKVQPFQKAVRSKVTDITITDQSKEANELC